MDDRTRLLRRVSMEIAGRFLADNGVVFIEKQDHDQTEESRMERMRDDLEIAMRDEEEKTREKVRKLADEAWECGGTYGFLEGMRAGACMVLALIGEGEIRI